jgi:hypothetical protein
MQNVRKGRYLVLLLLLTLTIFDTHFIASQPFGEGGSSDSPPSPHLSVNAEQDNVDSFDVNPKSGRWNVSKDQKTDDLVTDSQLRLTTVENATGSSSEYLMDRGLRKLDSKVEFRLSGDGGGNESEYFRDTLGDESDFEEGDLDNWASDVTGVLSVSDGILNVQITANFSGIIHVPSAEQPTVIIKRVETRVKTNDSNAEFFMWIRDSVSGDRYVFGSEAFSFDANQWFDLSIALTGFGLPTGTAPRTWNDLQLNMFNVIGAAANFSVEYFRIITDLDFASHVEGEIEDTWDWEEADVEGWAGLTNRTNDGLGNMLMGGQGATPVIADVGNTILTTQFHLVVMNITALEGVNITIIGNRGGQLILSDKTAIPADTSVVLTFDLSDDSDWTGTFDWVGFSIDDFENGETLWLDYFLLLGDWDPVDATIGLFDTDTDAPLLNVSLHFTSNNSHPTDSQVSTIEVELMDQDGEIAFNFTESVQIHGLLLRGKITYDMLESELSVKLEFDNGTRILRISLPLDFTSQSGRVPALFSLEKTPSVFLSTYTASISWQTVRLDFINAPYKEREWAQIDSPPDPNWLFQNWDAVRIEDDISDETSNWSLTVPYLDSVSGVMRVNISDFGDLDFNDDIAMWLQILGVDSDDGELHRIVKIRLEVANNPGIAAVFLEILPKGGVHQFSSDFNAGKVAVEVTPRVDFTISLTRDRSILNLKLRFTFDETVPTEFVDTSVNYTISDIVDDPSQEFVIRTGYIIEDFTGNTEAVLEFIDFGFVERDIFTDIVKAIIDPIGNFLSSIFAIAFRFLATIFQIVGDLIIFANEVAFAALQVAVVSALGLLETAIDAATTAIGTMQTILEAAIEALEPFMTIISEAVDALWTLFIATLSDIVDELIILASSFADFFFDVLELLIPFLITFLGTILGSLFGLIADLVFFVWDALSLPNALEFLDFVLVGFGQFVTGVLGVLTDSFTFLASIAAIFSVLGFILFFIIPIAQGADEGEFLSHMFENMAFDLSFGWQILGIGGKVPIVIPWLMVTVFTIFSGTPFIGFF